MRILTIAMALGVLVAATQAQAGNAEKCSAAKMKASAKYAACRLAAASKAKSTGVPADYAKCDAGLDSSWTKAEGKYTTDCPTSTDRAALQADLTAATSCVATELAGPSGSCDTSAEFLCGNGVVDPGEACDQSDLDGATCESEASGAQGVLTCAADCQDFDTSDCVPCPAGGVVVEGQCWVLGPAGESCVAACGHFSMVTSAATLALTLADTSRCGWILHKLGTTYFRIVAQGSPVNMGCWTVGVGQHPQLSYSVTQEAAFDGLRRACACQ